MFLRVMVPLLLALLQGIFSLGASLYEKTDWQWQVSIVGTAVLGVLLAVAVAVAAEKGHRARMKLDVENILQATMLQLSNEVGLDLKHFSLRAFKVYRLPWTLWFRREQRSIGVARLKGGLPELVIRWRKGVGIVGVCWEDKAVTRAAQPRISTRGAWNRLSNRQRFGFDWDQWRMVRGRYKGLVAYPLIAKRGFAERKQYLGCVVLGAFTEEAWKSIDADRVEETDAQLDNAANALMEVLTS